MRKVEVTVDLFEKGDRVFTPDGWATVACDEQVKDGLFDREVRVLLDEPTSGHPTRRPFAIDAALCIPARRCREHDPATAPRRRGA
jgi:hypothetical protein